MIIGNNNMKLPHKFLYADPSMTRLFVVLEIVSLIDPLNRKYIYPMTVGISSVTIPNLNSFFRLYSLSMYLYIMNNPSAKKITGTNK